MNHKVVLLVLAILILFGQNAFADYDTLITKIDKAWVTREGDTRSMKDALAWAEQAYGEKPGFDAAWRAARACFWICDRTTNRDTDLNYGKRGVEWAEKAIKAGPNRVEGHYYYTVCLGEYGKGMSIVTALAKGLGSKFEKACAKAISIEAGYDHGSPHRALGRYWYSLPWPKYSFEKSETAYLTTMKLAPKAARTYVYLAELYIKEKKFDKAREILTKLEGLDAGYSDSPFEYKFYKKVGNDLMIQIEGK